VYKIHEIFDSVQFEGTHAGTPARFIRFYGCNLKCPFCDTPQNSYQIYTKGELQTAALAVPRPPLLVLTGGEPTLQVTAELCDYFLVHGFRVAIETNGTQVERLATYAANVWITFSPKPIKNWQDVYQPIFEEHLYDEVKLVYKPEYEDFITKCISQVYSATRFAPIFIQPADNSPKGYQQAIKFLQRFWDRGVRLSVQAHKFIGVP